MSRFEAQTLRHPATCLVLRAETLTGISPSLKLVASDSKRIQTIAHGLSNGQFKIVTLHWIWFAQNTLHQQYKENLNYCQKASVPLLFSLSKWKSFCSKCNKLTNQLLCDTLATIWSEACRASFAIKRQRSANNLIFRVSCTIARLYNSTIACILMYNHPLESQTLDICTSSKMHIARSSSGISPWI